MKDLKQIIEEKYNYTLNKSVFRYTFFVLLCVIMLVFISNDIYTIKDLQERNVIMCEAEEFNYQPKHNNLCLNPFYNPMCSKNLSETDFGNTCGFEYLLAGTCIDLEGKFVDCPPKPNVFYDTAFTLILSLLVIGFLINDYIYNKQRWNK